MIRVGVNGYGTIGKRIADAILLQEDMELVGITANSYNYKLDLAADDDVDIYAVNDKAHLEERGLDIKGNVKDLLKKVDIVVDAAPKPVGSRNIEELYKPTGVKAIVQGGEKSHSVEQSFVAQANYEDALNKDYVRVVSCNTTGLSRTLHALDEAFGVRKAHATLIRRGGDPHMTTRGPINAIVPSFELPSHHGPDVRSVLPHLEVFTTAVIVPTTLMHMHNLSVDLEADHDVSEVMDVFDAAPRIRVIRKKHGIRSTAEIMELARDLGYKRSDMNDLCVWEEGIGHYDGELFFPQAVHQESIVVPENIDAIRAMIGFEDKEQSINMTNESLGL